MPSTFHATDRVNSADQTTRQTKPTTHVDYVAFHQMRDSLNEELRTALDKLSAQVLSSTDRFGKSTLQHLVELHKERSAPLNRHALSHDIFRDVLIRLSDPAGGTQDRHGTCALETIQVILNLRTPGEWTRFARGLLTTGKVDVDGLGTNFMKVPYDFHKPDESHIRSQIDAALQGAFKNWAADPGWRYSNKRDQYVKLVRNADGILKIEQTMPSGLHEDNAVKLMNMLFPGTVVKRHGDIGDFFNHLSSKDFEPIYTVLKWGSASAHAVAALKVQEGRIYFRNAHGDTGKNVGDILGTNENLDGHGPLRRVEDPATGIESMILTDFHKNFMYALEVQASVNDSMYLDTNPLKNPPQPDLNPAPVPNLRGSSIGRRIGTGVVLAALAVGASVTVTWLGRSKEAPPTDPNTPHVDKNPDPNGNTTGTTGPLDADGLGALTPPAKPEPTPPAPEPVTPAVATDTTKTPQIPTAAQIAAVDPFGNKAPTPEQIRQNDEVLLEIARRNGDNRRTVVEAQAAAAVAANTARILERRINELENPPPPASSARVSSHQFDQIKADITRLVPFIAGDINSILLRQPDGPDRIDGAGQISLGKLYAWMDRFENTSNRDAVQHGVVVDEGNSRHVSLIRALEESGVNWTQFATRLSPDARASIEMARNAPGHPLFVWSQLIPPDAEFGTIRRDIKSIRDSLPSFAQTQEIPDQDGILRILAKYGMSERGLEIFVEEYNQTRDENGQYRVFKNDIRIAPLAQTLVEWDKRGLNAVTIAKNIRQDPLAVVQLINAVGDLTQQPLDERVDAANFIRVANFIFWEKSRIGIPAYVDKTISNPEDKRLALAIASLYDGFRVYQGLREGSIEAAVNALAACNNSDRRNGIANAYKYFASGLGDGSTDLNSSVSQAALKHQNHPLTEQDKKELKLYVRFCELYAGVDLQPTKYGLNSEQAANEDVTNGSANKGVTESLANLFALSTANTTADKWILHVALDDSLDVWTKLKDQEQFIVLHEAFKALEYMKDIKGQGIESYPNQVLNLIPNLPDQELKIKAGELVLASSGIDPKLLKLLRDGLVRSDPDAIKNVLEVSGTPISPENLTKLRIIFSTVFGPLDVAIDNSNFSDLNKAAIRNAFNLSAPAQPLVVPVEVAQPQAG